MGSVLKSIAHKGMLHTRTAQFGAPVCYSFNLMPDKQSWDIS